uniref:AMP-dependent synthetase/ligase domain-containing protein n=1 Tax=Phlebotomus papatasi TaxID=29031 RepID=A0A1B0GNK2_PHLPP
MEYDLSSLQTLICGGATLNEELADHVKLRIPNLIGIRQGYGLSETFVAISCIGIKTKPGSVGTVVKGTYCKVVDLATSKSLGPNETGELYLKSLQTMKGYIGNDAATKEAFDPEGWLRTGDLGYYDEDEFFFIVDRIKEVIKYRALQVPPAELEALLLSHPKIADAGVTGIPNEADGEHPIAFVVKKPNEEITEQEIKDYIANLVIDIKRLRGG